MHDVYDALSLLKLTVQIESLTAYDDNLLVGTRQGHLLMYSVTARNLEQKPDVQLLRYNKTFSKKPIQQLDVVPEYQILIRLSDNVISIHDMSIINFPIVSTILRTKGATLFTLDVKRQVSLTGVKSVMVRMCVVVKRRLQLFYWKNGQFLDLADDLVVKDVPRAIAWCQETLCIGFKGEYMLLKLSGTQVELFPTGKHLEPSVTKLSDDAFVLGKDSTSIFMNTAGDPTLNYVLKWSEVPIEIACDEPYLLALLSESVEVRTYEPSLHIQNLTLKGARIVCRCRQGLVYAASTEHVWIVRSVPVARQIHFLLEEKRFQLALKLTNLSDDTKEEKANNIHQIQTLYAFDLFHRKQFHDSMEEFLKLHTDCSRLLVCCLDPYEVIRLFPSLLPQQAKDETGGSTDGATMKLEERDLENGLLALIEYLTEVRNQLMTKKTPTKSSELKSTMQLMQIIDTTLLKCYLQTNDALVAPLLRRNHCHLDETERTLKRHAKFSELIILYQTKGLHRKALELLQKQASQADSSLRGHERTVHYLQNLGKEQMNLILEFAGWVLDSVPQDGIKIFIEDMPEVEHLPRPRILDYLLKSHKDLVIPYLEHVVHVWKDTNALFHNALIHQYQERARQLSDPALTGAEHQAAQHLRSKLLSLLDKSDCYTPESVLIQLPLDGMFEERAIVLGKLGKHEQALAIYVTVLGNIQRATDYCVKVYKQKSPGSEQVYVALMRLLISPPDNCVGPPDLETAIALLEANADRIPALPALKELPDSVPLATIKHFLTTSLHNELVNRTNTQLLKGLLYAEHLQVQELRMHYESQSVLMTEFNVCPVCKKRFGNQSAFIRYPNGDIVHYSCQGKYT